MKKVVKYMVYLVERNGAIDWDEYFGFVVIASSPEEAEETTFKEHNPDERYSGWTRDVTVEELGTSHTNEVRIVQESYNKG